MSQRILQHTDLQHVIHHMSVIVLFRGHLRRVLQDPLVAPHLPFATNFEDEAGPILSRLFFYAEMTAASVSGFGCYSKPTGRAPQTYRQLHEHVFGCARRSDAWRRRMFWQPCCRNSPPTPPSCAPCRTSRFHHTSARWRHL